jgi:nitrogen regulatory protein P-II 2
MNTVQLTLLTIIAEALLKDRLLTEIRAAGAKGYTVTEASGEGSRQRRVSEFLGDNLKIEVITTPQIADRLLAVLAAEYFPHFAVIAYLGTVQVVRGDKYV